MYGEALKNLEQLEFVLSTTSPSFSIIDEPYKPIKPKAKSYIVFSLVFLFFFSFLFIVIIWLRSKYNEKLNLVSCV
jgi:uncharacterized protein involved in exopolysaccharide biosynthesis